VVYHPNPMDAKTSATSPRRYRATLIIQHADLLRLVRPQMPARAVRHARYAIVGAEKLRDPIACAFKDKFGIDLLEGYGCTRWRPIVGVNLPGPALMAGRARGRGTVGLPLPGVAAKVVDPARSRVR